MQDEYVLDVVYLESRDLWMAKIEGLDIVAFHHDQAAAIKECADKWDFYAVVSHHHEEGRPGAPVVLPTIELRPNSFVIDGELYELLFDDEPEEIP